MHEKGEIEELVRLSFQALERDLEERSRTIISERGWGEANNIRNRRVSEMRSHEPWAAAPYPPPSPEYLNRNHTLTDTYLRSGDANAPAQGHLAPLPPRERPSVRRRARPIIIPPTTEGGRQEQDTMRTARSEMRFTLPRAQLFSHDADIATESRVNLAKPDVPTTKTDDEILSVRRRLERCRRRKVEAENGKDIASAYDLINFGIPDLEAKLENLLTQQREQEKLAAPVTQNEESKRSHHTEVETESEYSDDEEDSEAGPL